MVVVPLASVVAIPLEPFVLLIVATALLEEIQATEVVIFFVVLSEYVPVAVNCMVVPESMLRFVGVTEIETRFAVVVFDPPLPQLVTSKKNRI
jgi:hypothetical protein